MDPTKYLSIIQDIDSYSNAKRRKGNLCKTIAHIIAMALIY